MSSDPKKRPEPFNPEDNKRILAAVFGLLLGGLGVHKFYLGKPVPGVIHIVLFACLGLGYVIAIAEGIRYLRKSDQEFYETYVAGDRNWF